MYGFKGCDSVRKAIKWLDSNNISYEFTDYRKTTLSDDVVSDWFKRVGWETVLNKNSAAFRELPGSDKANITESNAKRLIMAHTNLIKRPVLDTGKELHFGFSADSWWRSVKEE